MNKKIIAIAALLLCAVLLLSSCGSQEAPAGGKTEGTASGKERVVLYTAAEDERISYLQ